jgi:hypothetical protein
MMIGTTGATILYLINVLLASVLGVGAGGLTCLILRLKWGVKAALIDAVLAAIVAVITAYVAATIETARGVWASNVTLVLVIAVISVVIRHLVQLALRPAN